MTHPVDSLPNFHAVLRHWALERPEQVAFHFLPEGEAIEGVLTFADLDLRARALAARLQARDWRGAPLLLQYRPGLQFIVAFFACLYAGAIAVPAYPPTSNRSKSSRLRALVASCGAQAVLTDTATLPNLDLADLAAGLPVECTDELDPAQAAHWNDLGVGGERIAFLQYSSGSTGDPKGVIVTHGNLLHNQQSICAAMGNGPHTVFASWLPLFHDMGLVGNVMQPLYLGVPCYLMPPMAFMQKPRRWLEVISRYGVTCTGGPNFAFDLCVDRIPEHERAGLDLSRWDVAYNGSEPVRGETLRRFVEAYRPYGLRAGSLYPCYGLAEGTLLVSGPMAGSGYRTFTADGAALAEGRIEPGTLNRSTLPLTSCGQIWGGQSVLVVDPASLVPCAPSHVGEIWLRGPSISGGYWKRPDADAAIHVHLPGDTQSGRYCRTGDLGAFVDGELYVTGRIKEMLIVRGRNHYPQDIEDSVQSAWPGFVRGGGAAFMDGDRLVLVQEISRTALRAFDAAAAERLAREALAQHHGLALAELVAIKPATLTKTSSGKICRYAIRDSYCARGLSRIDTPAARRPSLPTMTEVEPSAFSLLVSILTTLGIRAEAIAPEATLWQLGLDSLQIVDLHERLAHHVSAVPPLDLLFSGATLATLASSLVGHAAAPVVTPKGEMATEELALQAEERAPVALTPYQAAIWLRQQQTDEPIYNLAVAVEFAGPTSAANVEAAFDAVMAQHRHLRQCLNHAEDGSLQWRDAPAPVVRRVSTAGWSEPRLDAALRDFRAAPFALDNEAPLRACIFESEAGRTLLALCIHHIATDFAGASNLVTQLLQAVGGSPVSNKVGSSRAARSLQRLADASIPPQSEWLAGLAAAPAELDLGVALPHLRSDGPVSLSQHYADLDADLFGACRQAAQHAGSTLNVFLVSAFAALLHRYSGQPSLCMGMPFSVRPRALADWPGNAVNMVPIAFEFGADESLSGLVARTNRGLVQGLQHRHVPLIVVADHVRRLQPGRTRIFDVVFICQAEGTAAERLPAALLAGCETWHDVPVAGRELRVRSRRIPSTTCQALLTLLVFPDRHGGARLSLEFDRQRVPQAFAARVLGHYDGFLRAAVRQPHVPVAELAYLPRHELDQQWLGWNAAGWGHEAPKRTGRSLVSMFLAQARSKPLHIAAADFHGATLSFAELEQLARSVQGRLRARGVCPGQCVGIALPRDHRLPAAILGVLMCGAAYVPLDLDYPPERLRYILQTSEAHLVVTVTDHAAEFEQSGAQCLRLDAEVQGTESEMAVEHEPRASDLAYVLFTSGSTGQPKGVQVTHGNVMALLDWAGRTFTETERTRILASTSICFDLSVFEFFAPLCLGTTCVVTPHVLDVIERPDLGITLINTVPSAIEALLAAGSMPLTVSVALVAGEPFRQALVERLYRESSVRRVFDLYGPTEDTVYSTAATRRPAGRESIGRPLPGTRAYVLDAARQPVAVGVAGELYLAGCGLSLGYRGRDDLTAAAFALPASLAHLESRVYRTGDIVRLAEDGDILYLGRRDHQVKVRGYRIELQEIDACLALSGLVREAVADVLTTPQGQPVLVAHVVWLVSTGGLDAHQALDAHLARHLPHYMRPQHLLVLNALPRTLNGKVDRRALPKTLAEHLACANDEPLDKGLETELASAWAEVLGTMPASRHANFIELGGNSLSAIQLREALRRRLSLDLPLSVLLTMPVLSQQAEVLADMEAAAAIARADEEGAELEVMNL